MRIHRLCPSRMKTGELRTASLKGANGVKPSNPRIEGQSLPLARDFDELSRAAQAEGSGLDLGCAFLRRL